MYIFKSNILGLKRIGFFIDMLNRPFSWRKWAFDRFGREETLNQLPSFGKLHPSSVLHNIQAKIAIGRPYCDEFFEFETWEDPVTKKKRQRLKQHEELMHLFILNAYLTLTNGGVVPENATLDRIDQILEDVVRSQLPGRPEIFLYLALHSTVIYYRHWADPKLKAEKQSKMVDNAHQILQTLSVESNPLPIENHQKNVRHDKKIVITRVLRPLAILEWQTYRLQTFKSIFTLLQVCPEDLQRAIKFNSMSGEIGEIISVITNYMAETKSKDPLVLFGEFKKHEISANFELGLGLEFYSATHIQFDRTVTTDFLLKIKDTLTGKETKIMLDLGVKLDWNGSPEIGNDFITVRKYWKKKYISEWYRAIFEVCPEQTIQEYILSGKFQKYL